MNCSLIPNNLGPYQTASCQNSTCKLDCAAGLSLCSGTCVFLPNDPANCGTCGHACASGQVCAAGTCAPASTIRILSGLSQPEDIVVDANNIYWTDIGDNSVWQANKQTLVKTQLGSGRVALSSTR